MTASDGPMVVSVWVDADPFQEWAGAAMSESGVCYYIHEVATGAGTAGTFYGSDPLGAACDGGDASAAVGPAFP